MDRDPKEKKSKMAAAKKTTSLQDIKKENLKV